MSTAVRDLARQELERRYAARTSLVGFTSYTLPTYIPEPAHYLIADHLEKVLRGEIQNLMIFAPPQHGKSELASRRFPVFWLSKHPDWPVMLTSYSGGLASRHGGDARATIEDDRYRMLFPHRLRTSSRASDFWRIEDEQGFMLSAGLRGPITGSGAMLGIVDDPFASWEEAQSPTMQKKAYEWFSGTFLTRLWTNSRIILIMTRWHENDLAGKLLKSEGDLWTVLRLPALAETQQERDKANRRMGLPQGQPDPLSRRPGEALCPIRYPRETLLLRKRRSSTMVWNAEYQGSPTPAEGNRIKREWLEYFVAHGPGRTARRIRYWDKAGSQDEGKYTAGVRVALGPDDLVYIEDVKRGQWSAAERERIIKATATADAQEFQNVSAVVQWVEQEPGSGGLESADNTMKNLLGFSAFKDPPHTNKDVRLEPFAAAAENHLIRLVRGLWNENFIDEMAAVPYSALRDQADAVAGAFNKLTKGGFQAGQSDLQAQLGTKTTRSRKKERPR